jgi:hypothetical protein
LATQNSQNNSDLPDVVPAGENVSITLGDDIGINYFAWKNRSGADKALVNSLGNFMINDLQVLGIPYLPTPPAATDLVLTEVADTVEVAFEVDTNYNIDYMEVWSSQESDSAGFGLISIVNLADWVQGDNVTDATFSKKTTTYYQVYTVRAGTRSTALTGNIALSNNASAITDLTVTPTISTFILDYTLPTERKFSYVTIYKDAQVLAASLLEANAVLVYSGTNNHYVYNIPDADLDKYHEFWVSTVTAT